ARAHFGIGLEPAAAHDHGAPREVVFAARRRHPHPFDPAVVAVDQAHALIVADLDAVPVECNVAQLTEHARAAADRMDVVAAGVIKPPVALGRLLGLPGNPDVLQPVHGGVRLIDQAYGEHGIDAALRHPAQVFEEILPRVGWNLHPAEALLRNLRE